MVAVVVAPFLPSQMPDAAAAWCRLIGLLVLLLLLLLLLLLGRLVKKKKMMLVVVVVGL